MKGRIGRSTWLQVSVMILTPILGMALGAAVTTVLPGTAGSGNLIVNLGFLASCAFLWWLFGFTREEAGLKLVRRGLQNHVVLSLAILGLYLLFYVFAIRISGLRPLSAATAMSLLTYLVVVVAEETYFRGMLYGFIERRSSRTAALLGTSILFGLFHASQGVSGIISRAITGWLWGSVRYSTGMIFLLIFPVHYAYNSIWVLFEGNWDNPPTWGIILLPALELVLGLAIVVTARRGRR